MVDNSDGKEPTDVRIQSLYFNGMQLALSNSDISAILLLNGAPQIALSMSFTTAKTLYESLGNVIDHLESVTKHKVMTMSEVADGLSSAEPSTTNE